MKIITKLLILVCVFGIGVKSQAQCGFNYASVLDQVFNSKLSGASVEIEIVKTSNSLDCHLPIQWNSLPDWLAIDRVSSTTIRETLRVRTTKTNNTSSDRVFTIEFSISSASMSVDFTQPSNITSDFNEENINNTSSIAYDITGKVISKSRNYFDDLGKPIQSQSIDIKEAKVWTSVTKYDSQGRLEYQTSSAPKSSGGIRYINESDFISFDTSGPSRFDPDKKTMFPYPLQGSSILGSHYADHNENGILKDNTRRPYSKPIYDDLNPGKVLRNLGGNPIDLDGDNLLDNMPEGFSHGMQAAQELYYAFGIENLDGITKNEVLSSVFKKAHLSYGLPDVTYSHGPAFNYYCEGGDTWPDDFRVSRISKMPKGIYYVDTPDNESIFVQIAQDSDGSVSTIASSNAANLVYPYVFQTCQEVDRFKSINNNNNFLVNNKIQKTVAIDPHGEEVVSFAYDDGRVLATARSGEGPKKQVKSLIGKQGWVDIHLPKNCGGSLSFVGGTNLYDVYNLRTSVKLTNLSNIPSGVYRVALKENTEPINYTYIDHQGNIEALVPGSSRGVTYDINYYDYSLNYYDDAGNLTSSLQPLGFNNDVYANYNLTGTVSHINDNLKSYFQYNSLGQLLYTSSPDEGEAWFKYRKDGQIRFSQNSKQQAEGKFSYTNYDNRARPIESGVVTADFDDNTLDPDNDVTPSGAKEEKHNTKYDLPERNPIYFSFGSDSRRDTYLDQSFVSGNVSATYSSEGATWYSYDIYGRVTWIVQRINGLDSLKTIDYEYDPVTGAVNEVIYQKGVAAEEFRHRYTYDTDDYSLTKVETKTTSDPSYITHADYKYYETGELRRVELANDSQGNPLQGIDYVYNINGALKAINHPSLTEAKDPGGDSDDVFGMQIDYYKGDYLREGNHIATLHAGEDQYNGNIKAIRWNNRAANDGSIGQEKTYVYDYNRNNWLEQATYGNSDGNPHLNDHPSNIPLGASESVNSGESLDRTAQQEITLTTGFSAKQGSTVHLKIQPSGASFTATTDYQVSNLEYDANGNIQSLRRNKNKGSDDSNEMDDLYYHYDPNKPNQLKQVQDNAPEETNAPDIKHQTSNNYEYNVIGQLIKNNSENVEYIYNTSGLVTEVKKDGVVRVKFFYNDRGQRVRKETFTNYGENGGPNIMTERTFYVRDAAGKPLAIYNSGFLNNNHEPSLTEHTVYGASRLGVYSKRTRNTNYEITDHLGNVRAVVSRANNNEITKFGTDYYPFGMPMPNRDKQGNYRYAFQGQEKDKETGKEAFELRLWDARIGRWLSPDPYGQYHSPYLGMGNNPSSNIDSDGGWVTAVTALAGGLINAGINIYSQGGINENLDWKRVGVAFVGGAIAGATGNLQAAVVTNTAFDIADQLIANGGNYKDINYTQAAVTGALTYVGGKFIGPRLSNTKLVKGISVKLSTKAHSTRFYSPYVNNFKGGFTSGFKQGANGAKINKAAFDVSSEIIGGLGAGSGSTVINKTFGGIPKIEDVFKDGFKPFDNHFFHFMNNLNHYDSGNNVKFISTEVRLIGIEE